MGKIRHSFGKALKSGQVKHNWFGLRLLFKAIRDHTPLLFWMAQGRRTLRYRYRDWAAWLMFTCSKILFKVDIQGRENFRHKPSTILACGHKRDFDIPIIIPRLYAFRFPPRIRAMQLLYVATRDDFYERGFLVTYFTLLDWARPFLVRSTVARMMRDLQTCPVKLPDEQTVNQLLQETRRMEGNLTVQEALTDDWRQRLLGDKANDSKLTLLDALLKAPLPMLGQYATPRMFREPLSSRIRERHHQLLVKQLYDITRILERGGTLFIHPEGRVSPDGRLSKMRAALSRVVQTNRADVKMVPINLTYDFMDSKRRYKVIVLVGEEVSGLKAYSKTELAELVGLSVSKLSCITMSGLGSRKLIELAESGQDRISYNRFRDALWEAFLELKGKDLPFDRQLETRQGFEERLERFVAYCKKKNKIMRELDAGDAGLDKGDEWLVLHTSEILRPDCQKPDDHPVRYCYNELLGLLAAHGLVQESTSEAPENVVSFKAKSRAKKQVTAG